MSILKSTSLSLYLKSFHILSIVVVIILEYSSQIGPNVLTLKYIFIKLKTLN